MLHGSLFSEIVDNAVNELLHSKLIESIRMTEDEKKIIKFLSAGISDKAIAKELSKTVSIVKGHIHNILEKMSLNTRVQIAIYRNSGGEYFSSADVKPMKTKKLKNNRTKLAILRDLSVHIKGNKQMRSSGYRQTTLFGYQKVPCFSYNQNVS